MSAVPAEVVDAKTSVEVSQVEFLFMFCCDFGVPGTAARGPRQHHTHFDVHFHAHDEALIGWISYVPDVSTPNVCTRDKWSLSLREQSDVGGKRAFFLQILQGLRFRSPRSSCSYADFPTLSPSPHCRRVRL